MQWSKQVKFSDGSELSATVEIDDKAHITYTLTTVEKGKTSTLNLLQYYDWGRGFRINMGGTAPQPSVYSIVHDDVWLEIFNLYKNAFEKVLPSELTSYQKTILHSERGDEAVFKSDEFKEEFIKLTVPQQVRYLAATFLNKEDVEFFLQSITENTLSHHEVTDARTLFFHLNPHLSQEDENYVLLKRAMRYYYLNDIKDNEELKTYYTAAYFALTTARDDLEEKPLRDLNSENDFDRSVLVDYWCITHFPLNTSKYRNYLLDLPVKDYRKLIGNVPSSMSAASAIKLSDRIIQDAAQEEENYLVVANEEFQEIFKVLADKEDANVIISSYSFFMERAKYPHLRKLIKSFFTEVITDDEFTLRKVMPALNMICGENVTRWVSPGTRANDILAGLCEVLPPDRVIFTLREIASEKDPLSAAQWEKFVKESDTYKDLPVSWWKNLVKTVRATPAS